MILSNFESFADFISTNAGFITRRKKNKYAVSPANQQLPDGVYEFTFVNQEEPADGYAFFRLVLFVSINASDEIPEVSMFRIIRYRNGDTLIMHDIKIYHKDFSFPGAAFNFDELVNPIQESFQIWNDIISK